VQLPAFAADGQAAETDAATAVARLLRSADPRDQASGAFYAGRDVMPRMIPEESASSLRCAQPIC